MTNDHSRCHSSLLDGREYNNSAFKLSSYAPAYNPKKPKSMFYKNRSLLNCMLVLNVIILVMGTAYATVPPSANSKTQKMERIKYFINHSFDFTSIFNRYHQSPGWFLRHRKELKLTNRQIVEETRLKRGMQRSTAHDVAKLKAAYRTYALDGAKANPPISLIKKDIELVGHRETILALEMVPYHLTGYKILDSSQRKIYADIESKFIASLNLSMYTSPFGDAN